MNKKLFSALFFAACCLLPTAYCFAQDTPGTVRYPTQLDTPDSLFRITDAARTTLASSVNSSATTMTVAGTTTFPDSGSIKVEEEIIYYTSKNATQFLGLVRGAGGSTAASHAAGLIIRAPILAVHHNTLADAIIATQTKVGSGSSTPALNAVLVGSGVGSSSWSAQPAIDCTNCTNVPAGDLSNLNASNLTSGTIPDARFPATLPAASGANLTGLTKAQVGLSGVDNTSDAAKPVSTAQQTALDLKANLASPALTGTPTAPTAAADTNTTQIATTAHVFAERSNTATLINKTLTSPVINTPTGIAFTDISGSVTDAQVPNTITVDLATVAATANAGDSATAFFSGGTIETARLGSGTANSTTFLRGDNTWQAISGGTPGGSNTQVQYNNAGGFGGIANATSDGTTITLTSPKIVTAINDTNGNELIKFTATGSAVNELVIANAATGSGPSISATGGDSHINAALLPKGNGYSILGHANGRVAADINSLNVFNDNGIAGGINIFRVQGNGVTGGPTSHVALANFMGLQWSGTIVATGTKDLGIDRSMVGLLEVNNGTLGTYRDLKVRQHYVDQTITPGGTTGNQTINKSFGTVNIAASGTTVTVTNSLVTANSTIIPVLRTNDSTATIKNVVPGAGSFVITLAAAATAEVSIGFWVVNQ